MRVMVFGGSGFLGSHVADALSDAGHDVTIFDIRPSPYIKPNQRMIVGDIMDVRLVSSAMAGSDCVYNFAGVADLDDAMTKPCETVRLNIEGNVNILEACRTHACKRFVYASSVYVYSSKGGFYRCSKQAAELYIEEYSNRCGLNYTILRYGTLYGPRADRRNSIYRYLSSALIHRRLDVSGTGQELREYIHVRDAARLSVKVLGEEYANRHLIITGLYPTEFRRLLETIREILGNSISIEYHEPTEGNHYDHYSITPYSFTPKIGEKLTTDCSIDIGQGLLECLQQIYSESSGYATI